MPAWHSDEFEQAEPFALPAAFCTELLVRVFVDTNCPVADFGAALSFGGASDSETGVALALGTAELVLSRETAGAGASALASVPSVGRAREQASVRTVSNVSTA